MDTPKRMDITQTLEQISRFLTLNCRLEGPHKLNCVGCGGEIRRVRAYMSLHNERFGDACVGPGLAWRMEIPYCTACEAPPSLYGCIHMSDKELNLPTVLEACRPRGAIPGLDK